jgi:hypothetical protein
MSVVPSAALTRNRSGGVQPVAVSLLISARSSSTSTRPAQSRTQDTGGVSTVDAESMKYAWLSGMVTMWSSSSSVTLAKPEPSSPTRHTVRRYGSSSTSPEAVKYTTRSASSTCRICRTAHCPEVTCPSSSLVCRSYRYRWPQPSRCEYHSTSSASTRTIGGSVIHWLGSTRVAPVSLSRVVTSPVAGSSRCRVSMRRSRGWLR